MQSWVDRNSTKQLRAKQIKHLEDLPDPLSTLAKSIVHASASSCANKVCQKSHLQFALFRDPFLSIAHPLLDSPNFAQSSFQERQESFALNEIGL